MGLETDRSEPGTEPWVSPSWPRHGASVLASHTRENPTMTQLNESTRALLSPRHTRRTRALFAAIALPSLVVLVRCSAQSSELGQEEALEHVSSPVWSGRGKSSDWVHPGLDAGSVSQPGTALAIASTPAFTMVVDHPSGGTAFRAWTWNADTASWTLSPAVPGSWDTNSSPAAAGRGGVIDVIGRAGGSYYHTYFNGTSWSAPAYIGALSGGSDPAVSIPNTSPAGVDVWAKNSAGVLYRSSWRNATGWSGFVAIGTPAGVSFNTPPAATTRADGVTDVVLGATNNHVYHGYFLPNGGAFQGWEQIPGATGVTPAISSPSSNRLDVWEKGSSDNLIYHFVWMQSTNTWSGAEMAINTPAPASPITSGLSVNIDSTGTTTLGGIGSDGFARLRSWSDSVAQITPAFPTTRFAKPQTSTGTAITNGGEDVALVWPSKNKVFLDIASGKLFSHSMSDLLSATGVNTTSATAITANEITASPSGPSPFLPLKGTVQKTKNLGVNAMDHQLILTKNISTPTLVRVFQQLLDGNDSGAWQPTGAPGSYRGAEAIFSSGDGQSWSQPATLDPCDNTGQAHFPQSACNIQQTAQATVVSPGHVCRTAAFQMQTTCGNFPLIGYACIQQPTQTSCTTPAADASYCDGPCTVPAGGATFCDDPRPAGCSLDQSGLDRPEVFASKDGYVYMAVNNAGNGGSKIQMLRASENDLIHWTVIPTDIPSGGAFSFAESDSHLYFARREGTPANVALYSYFKGTFASNGAVLTSADPFDKDHFKHVGYIAEAGEDGSTAKRDVSISVVKKNNSTFIRWAYPISVTGSSQEGVRFGFSKISAGGLIPIDSHKQIYTGLTKTIPHVSMISPNSDNEASSAVVYWYESTTIDSRVVAIFSDDVGSWSAPQTLDVAALPGGDYIKGSFFFRPVGLLWKPTFLAQWRSASNGGLMEAVIMP